MVPRGSWVVNDLEVPGPPCSEPPIPVLTHSQISWILWTGEQQGVLHAFVAFLKASRI